MRQGVDRSSRRSSVSRVSRGVTVRPVLARQTEGSSADLERGIWDEPPAGPGDTASDTPYEDNAK